MTPDSGQHYSVHHHTSIMEPTRQMIVKFWCSCVLFSLCLVQVAVGELGDHITICQSKDPKLEQCLITAGHQLISKLENGLPEFDIPPVDPMAVPKLTLQPSTQGSAVAMSLTLINSTHTGLRTTKINKASAKPEDYEFEFHASIPSYTIVGRYDAKGKIMLLPINGRGDSNITLYDVNSIWRIKGEPETRDGVKYMKLNKFDVTIVPKNMKVRFDNLFQGNQVLGDTMNNLLNTNWSDIYRQLKPALESSYSKIMFSFAEKIFSKTPYNKIFSDL